MSKRGRVRKNGRSLDDELNEEGLLKVIYNLSARIAPRGFNDGHDSHGQHFPIGKTCLCLERQYRNETIFEIFADVSSS